MKGTMQRRKFLRLSSLAAASTAVPGLASIALAEAARAKPGTKGKPQVPRWQPQDFSFNSRATPDNPFAVEFSADVTGPHGIRFTIPGFYDGDSTWKVRVSPTALGEWSLITRSADPNLDAQRATFTCTANTNPAVHGGLRVDPDHRSQFLYEDGSRYFPMGYECDWLWALDSGDPQLKTLNPFLDKIAGDGFNFIILNAFAYDTRWRKGRTEDDDYGPPPLYAWEGTNDKPDHSRFSLAYWQHYDRMMKALYHRGILTHILLRVYNELVDYRSDQQHTEWRKVMLEHLQQHTWPVINTEFGYECGPKGIADKTYNVAQVAEEVARRAWEVCMAGGFAAFYYTY